MARYHIKPEFMDLWGRETTEKTVVTSSDVKQFAIEWETTEEELLGQLIETEEE